jgi:transposase
MGPGNRGERVWAIEDCRHVSGGLERFLIDALADLVGERAPALLELACAAGVAPIPASSGKHQRHRLDRGGNRKLNCVSTRGSFGADRRSTDGDRH